MGKVVLIGLGEHMGTISYKVSPAHTGGCTSATSLYSQSIALYVSNISSSPPLSYVCICL